MNMMMMMELLCIDEGITLKNPALREDTTMKYESSQEMFDLSRSLNIKVPQTISTTDVINIILVFMHGFSRSCKYPQISNMA